MKNNLLTFLLTLLTLSSYAQFNEFEYDSLSNSLTIGHVDSVHSEILGETRGIYVHVPMSSKDPLFNRSRTYPVLYVLDGSGHFATVTGMMTQLSSINGNKKMPEMIVVGIPNATFAARWRDLSPTMEEGRPASGHSENFTKFLEKELMPYIEDKYPVKDHKTIIGHSLGGLFVVNTLLEHPQLFNNYIAVDPAVSWDNRYILNKADSILSSKNLENKYLYIGMANTMTDNMQYSTLREDTTENALHMRSILEFADIAEDRKSNGLNFKWKYYEDDTHGSVPLITEYDAFRFMYSWYDFKERSDLRWPEREYTVKEVEGLINDHFTMVSEKMGCQVYPDEQFMNILAYGFLRSDKPDLAYACFKMNMEHYPDNFNVYDSMGDYYEAIGDKKNAIRYYEKSVEMGGAWVTQERLDKLKASK